MRRVPVLALAVAVGGAACSIDVEDGFGSGPPGLGTTTPPSHSTGSASGDEPSTSSAEGTTGDGEPEAGSTSSGTGDPSTATEPSLPDGSTSSDLSTSGGVVPGSTSGDATTTAASGGETGGGAGACAAPATAQAIASWFFECGAGRVGQAEVVAGVTCEEVCCTFGYDACEGRAFQDTPFFCVPEVPAPSGSCDDVFGNDTTWQCLCS